MGIKRCQDLVYIFVIYQKDQNQHQILRFLQTYFSQFLMLLIQALDFEAKRVMKWLQKTKLYFINVP
jgi:hypothetical protein